MSKVSLLCVLVLLVSSSLSFIIKDCVDCEPQVSPVLLHNRVFLSIRIQSFSHSTFFIDYSYSIYLVKPFSTSTLLIEYSCQPNPSTFCNMLVRLIPLVLQPFNRLFLSTLSNLSLSTSKKLNFIHISPVIVLVLQPL